MNRPDMARFSGLRRYSLVINRQGLVSDELPNALRLQEARMNMLKAVKRCDTIQIAQLALGA